jgi:hypothetical protein
LVLVTRRFVRIEASGTEEAADLGYGVLEANATALEWRFVLSELQLVKDSVTITHGSVRK